jgi:hypothetical protein
MPPVDADLNFPESVHTREESDLPAAASAIGSTSGCGCDFPHVTPQNGQWPIFEDVEKDAERDANDRYNREGLVGLFWDGDFAEAPKAREEQGFYRVGMESEPSVAPATDR